MNGRCERCSQTVKRADGRFCSHACANAATWEKRPRAKVVSLSCQHCRGVFALSEARLRYRQRDGREVKFCSKACDGLSRRQTGTFVEVPCAQCGKQLTRRAGRLGAAAFCGSACRGAYDSTPGSKWSGYSPDKSAQLAYMREYTKRNRDRHNERGRAWAKNNRAYRNFMCQVRRAAGVITFDQWQAVFDKSGHVCVACGSADRLQLDHIVPVARGGRTEPDNLQVLCGPCNQSKGAKPFDEWMLWRHGIEILETPA